MDGDLRLPRQRQRDLDAADWARQSNRFLLEKARTRYRVGDALSYQQHWTVEIIEVMPAGYIVVPGRHSFVGDWLEPIRLTSDLYRFRGRGAGSPALGEARENELDRFVEFNEHEYRCAA